MTGILDRLLQIRQFTPTTADEYVALQLAKRLKDEGSIRRYLQYIGYFATEHLIHLYHRVKSQPDPSRAFHRSLSPDD